VAKLSHHWNDFQAFAIIPKPRLWFHCFGCVEYGARMAFSSFDRPLSGIRMACAAERHCAAGIGLVVNWLDLHPKRRIDSAAKYRPPEDDPHIPDLLARRGHAANQ
jgi:hypothetical protein